jgi:hypothetical protein
MIFAEVVIPKELFTKESVGSLTAVVAMVVVVGNGFQRLVNRNPIWLSFLVAEILCFVGMLSTNDNPRLLDFVVTVVNGFLVFSAAAGATSTGHALTAGKGPKTRHTEILTGGGERPHRGFFTSWFRR